MQTLKSLPAHQQHTLKQERLVFDFAIKGNATPSAKERSADIGGLVVLRTEGQIADADAVELLTWTAPDDDDGSGNSIFGILLNLDEDKADKLYLVTLAYTLADGSIPAPTSDILLTASTYGVLAGASVTNTGTTTINGDLGIDPGSTLSGAPTVTGDTNLANAASLQAQNDLTAAYVYLENLPSDGAITAGGGGLDSLVLSPGVYTSGSTMGLSVGATLTLDAGGNPNAMFVFQVGSAITLGNGSTVEVINGGSAANVYYQVTSDATIGTTATVVGTFVVLTSITMNTGATLDGRALARNGSVTLDSNEITVSGDGGISFVLTGPDAIPGPVAYITPEGNIAIEVAATNLNLSSLDSHFRMTVDYRERITLP